MAEESFANTIAMPGSPQCGEGFAGVRIKAEEKVSDRAEFTVYGCFRLPTGDAARIDAQLHKALVLVITKGSGYSVCNPFQNHVLFQDDEEELGGCKRGYFNVNIFDYLSKRVGGTYYVLVSLGAFLSNIVRVTVTGEAAS